MVLQSRARAAALVLLAARLAAPAHAQPAAAGSGPAAPPVAATPGTPETLSLDRAQAIAYALAHNPALVASREQVEEARAQVVVATALADPSVSATSLGQTGALSVGSRDEVDLGVGLTVPFPGKRGLQRKVATADLRNAEFTYAQLQQQTGSQTAQAYDALLVALRHAVDLEQGKQYAADFLDRTRARFTAGTVPKVDVVKAQADLAQAQNDLLANQRDIATARASLNRVLGRAAGAPIEPTETLEVPADLPAVEALERQALAARPELQGLAAQQAGARAATQLAREYWLPDFNLTAGRNAVDGAPTTYTTGVAIGVPLFFWQHQKGEVAAAVHREQELAASLADLRAQVSLDVRSNFAAAVTALQQAVFIRDQLLPEAREVYRVASTSYALGGSSSLELLDAKRTLLDAEKQYVDALGAANDARAALELAVGAPLGPAAGAQP